MSTNWHLIDATDQRFGRLASRLAFMLQGKDKPDFARHLLQAPHVVVINCDQLAVSEPRQQAAYYRHSGYLGNLKQEQFTDKPNHERLKKAVRNMLPTNKLRAQCLTRLHCYPADQHPYNAQLT